VSGRIGSGTGRLFSGYQFNCREYRSSLEKMLRGSPEPMNDPNLLARLWTCAYVLQDRVGSSVVAESLDSESFPFWKSCFLTLAYGQEAYPIGVMSIEEREIPESDSVVFFTLFEVSELQQSRISKISHLAEKCLSGIESLPGAEQLISKKSAYIETRDRRFRKYGRNEIKRINESPASRLYHMPSDANDAVSAYLACYYEDAEKWSISALESYNSLPCNRRHGHSFLPILRLLYLRGATIAVLDNGLISIGGYECTSQTIASEYDWIMELVQLSTCRAEMNRLYEKELDVHSPEEFKSIKEQLQEKAGQ